MLDDLRTLICGTDNNCSDYIAIISIAITLSSILVTLASFLPPVARWLKKRRGHNLIFYIRLITIPLLSICALALAYTDQLIFSSIAIAIITIVHTVTVIENRKLKSSNEELYGQIKRWQQTAETGLPQAKRSIHNPARLSERKQRRIDE